VIRWHIVPYTFNSSSHATTHSRKHTSSLIFKLHYFGTRGRCCTAYLHFVLQ